MKKKTPAIEDRVFVSGNGPILFLVIMISLIPLLVTPVLPLTDFYAHIARYYILANLENL